MNDISDEYRKVMVEGLEQLSRMDHLPKLSEVLVSVINEIRMLDKELADTKDELERTLEYHK